MDHLTDYEEAVRGDRMESSNWDIAAKDAQRKGNYIALMYFSFLIAVCIGIYDWGDSIELAIMLFIAMGPVVLIKSSFASVNEQKPAFTTLRDLYITGQHIDAFKDDEWHDVRKEAQAISAEKARKEEKRREGYRVEAERRQKRYKDSKRPRVPVKHTIRAFNDPRVSKVKATELKKSSKPAKIKGWQALRKQCFKLWGTRCAKCSWTPGPNEGHLLHADHIKPKSTHPELADDINNLQPLCHTCNTSKGARECFDYRPKVA